MPEPLMVFSRAIPRGPSVLRFLRASAVLALSLSYLGMLFRVRNGQFRTMGLGDWMDPYFINALLEGWYRAVVSLANPASPPFFFPAAHALGYSHGLMLYAPFYVPLRAVLHPFQAHTGALFLVMETGTLCLYVVLRRLRLSFVEALVLCAFFVSSPNVANGTTAVWAQRASVFLLPPILLIALDSARAQRRGRLALAFVSGLLAGLMYVQDFYTAQFAASFAACFALAALSANADFSVASLAEAFAAPTRRRRIALAAFLVFLAAAAWMFITGGGVWRIAGLRIAARDWRRPAVLALAVLAALVWRNPALAGRLRRIAVSPWCRAFLAGAAAGLVVFLWIYLGSFLEHPGFSKAEVWNALADRQPYPTNRPFVLAAGVALLAWMPAFGLDRTARIHAAWIAGISLVVLLLPLRFDGFAPWTAVVGRLPGFSAIRDPKRVIYLYELALAIATAFVAARAGFRYRLAVTLLAVVLMLRMPGREAFDYERPNALYDRWVAAPISVDPSCRSFFVKGASASYMRRSPDMWTLYGIDATFVALRYSIPTLNGYSAWAPDGWELRNPQEPSYAGRVRQWIDAHHLTGVCELDIDARTMTPSVRAR